MFVEIIKVEHFFLCFNRTLNQFYHYQFNMGP